MGFLSKLFSRTARRKWAARQRAANDAGVQRRCTFETMEPRRMLSASPLVLGTVYTEEDLGSDQHADRFEVTFSGGAEGTELTRLILNGDQNTPGFSVGDIFFDTEPTGLGADSPAGFTIEELISDNPAASVTATVADGTSLLVLDFQGFRAGDRLIFSVDVDEVEFLDPAQTDLVEINDGFDPITSGVEFQGSQLTAFFSAPHYQPASGEGVFWNRYDDELQASKLDLPPDNANNLRDRTTGAFLNTQQLIDPASISGYVYADHSNDGIRDADEPGLGGVTVRVIPVDTIEQQQAITVTTDANGFYQALDLSPGTYRVVEVTQPANYLDGLDTAGTVDGEVQGMAINPGDNLEGIFLAGGTQGIEYNFGEILPASISGKVHLSDRYGTCFVTGTTTEPLAGVTIHLLDQFDNMIGETVTDTAGEYAFQGLLPGLYSVVEFTPAGLIDAGAAAGLVGQASRGRVVDPNTITDIQLDAGDQGEQYDFCEHLPSSISGYVYHDRNDNGIREAGEEPITGTTVTLTDQNGTLVGTEQTDANGFYEFTGLSAGDYRIMETQPTDWLDGQESVGRVDGERSGSTPANDTFHDVRLLWGSAGIEYNFGELKPGSLHGVVHADLDRDCIYDPIESPIAHVKIELLSSAGVVLATSFTDSQGEYSFEGLAPGQYAVRETQPQGYFHGSQSAGSHGGDDSSPDIISQIPIGSGQQLVHYDFCEIVPGGISGIVYVDPNQNDQHESSELLLAGVRVQLLDADSKVLATATTNANGYYEFIDLEPGTYAVREFQPDGYFHSGQQAGSHGGNDTTPDLISAIAIGAGENLTQYNFSEIPPSSLEGMVYVSTGSCSIDPDIPLAHIILELLDGSGNVIGTTQTDSEGHYRFDGLQPDVYSVRETQPSEYYQGGQCVGSGGGSGTVDDLISAIDIAPGEDLVEYNFYEVPAATLSGFVFQDGPAIATLDGQVPDNLASLRDGRRTPDDRPISGVVIELRNGLTGLPILGEQLLAGAYADGPVTTVTDARGYYEFHSLPAGNYAVYETHPVEYIDGIDTAGTTAGLAFNFSHDVQGMSPELMGQLLSTLAENPREDAIVRIPLQAGQASVENNFSEVLVSTTLTLPPSPLPPPLLIPPVILVAPPAIPLPPSLLDAPRTNPDFQITGSAGELQMTWHLSVVNGGSPRGMDVDANVVEGIWRTVAYLDQTQWVSVSLQEGHWTFSEGASQLDGDDLPGVVFGISGAIPISGDFNGDGLSEMGVYHEGQWFIDVNGNGQWDEEDLWARLGTVEDLPVVGDWDGDGKDDIGIFGPEWRGDKQAVKAEPGLPDPQNEYRSDATQFTSAPKNLPPEEGEATNGHRVLKHTSSATPRVDVIDHVFRFGMSDDLPVAGDWNGDGIRSIGVFRNGTWFLDIDGDGRQSARDVIVTFGRDGDVPVVGDFTGDGTDQIGVYRHGIWILDSNGDRELDARDEVFQLGDEDARPVVGDWDGDGTDEPAVYRDAG